MNVKWKHESIWALVKLDGVEFQLEVRVVVGRPNPWRWEAGRIFSSDGRRLLRSVGGGYCPTEPAARRAALRSARAALKESAQ